MTAELLFVLFTIGSGATLGGECTNPDDIGEHLFLFAERLESGPRPSWEELLEIYPLFDQTAHSGRAELEPVLRRIAEAAGRLGGCNCDIICSALDCLWWSTRPVGYFKDNVERWKESPHLAAGSMRMIARDPEPGTKDHYLLIYEAAEDNACRSGVGCLEDGASDAAATERLRTDCEKLGPVDRVRRLIRAAQGTDWETEDVYKKEGEAGVLFPGLFIPGRNVCASCVYWAREQLRLESIRDPMLVAIELGNYEAELRSSGPEDFFKNEEEAKSLQPKLLEIRVPAKMRVLIYRVIDPSAAEIWEKLNPGKDYRKHDDEEDR